MQVSSLKNEASVAQQELHELRPCRERTHKIEEKLRQTLVSEMFLFFLLMPPSSQAHTIVASCLKKRKEKHLVYYVLACCPNFQRRSEAIDTHLNEFLGRVREHTHRLRASTNVAVASLQFARTGEYNYQTETKKFSAGDDARDGLSGDPPNAMDNLCRVLAQTQKIVESLAPQVSIVPDVRMGIQHFLDTKSFLDN